jgi:hypothetical protein
MTTVTVPQHTEPVNRYGEVHVTCLDCTPDGMRGICGARLKGVEVPDETPTTCPVCDDLEWSPCPQCGSYAWDLA